MTISDQWVKWWLEEGAKGVQTAGAEDATIIIEDPGGLPDTPGHTPKGIEWVFPLVDAPMDYRPPENFEWSPHPNKSYAYGMAISDGAIRDVLSDNPVRGLSMKWMCPTDNPECEYENMDAGMVFYVNDEDYAANASKTIEGQPIEYRVR